MSNFQVQMLIVFQNFNTQSAGTETGYTETSSTSTTSTSLLVGCTQKSSEKLRVVQSTSNSD